jgi:hypothetical protein
MSGPMWNSARRARPTPPSARRRAASPSLARAAMVSHTNPAPAALIAIV